mgnify:CR=1 FL=1
MELLLHFSEPAFLMYQVYFSPLPSALTAVLTVSPYSPVLSFGWEVILTAASARAQAERQNEAQHERCAAFRES